MADKEPIGEIKLEYPGTMAGDPLESAALGEYYVTATEIVVISMHDVTGGLTGGSPGSFPKRFRRDDGCRIPFDMRTWRLSDGWRKTVQRDVATRSK